MSDPMPDPLRRVGEDLRQAARARYERKPSRRRRWLVLGGVFVGVGAAGAAGAVQLIGVGKPLPDSTLPPRLRPTTGQVVLSVADPDGGAPWGLRVGRSSTGAACALAGRRSGQVIGSLQPSGVIRPISSSTLGVCGRPRGSRVSFTVVQPADPRPRTLVYGRIASGRRRVVVVAAGRPIRIPAGPQGTFLAVFRGRDLGSRDVRVSAEP